MVPREADSDLEEVLFPRDHQMRAMGPTYVRAPPVLPGILGPTAKERKYLSFSLLQVTHDPVFHNRAHAFSTRGLADESNQSLVSLGSALLSIALPDLVIRWLSQSRQYLPD